MTQADLARLCDVIRRSWAADTSYFSNWTPDRPSAGHCAVTALVLQDYLGGGLVRAEMGPVSHYWVRTSGGDIDLTRDQYEDGTESGPEQIRDRAALLSNPNTAARYRLLSDRVRRVLNGGAS